MPTPPKNLLNMSKHLTIAEKETRNAAESANMHKRVRMTPPEWLKSDLQAYQYWRKTLSRLKGISLLDDVDSDVLAVYCGLLARRDVLGYTYTINPDKDALNALLSTERLIVSYAEKLGLTPNGRARLAKQKTPQKEVDENADLFG